MLTPNWSSSRLSQRASMSMRSKWKKHVSAVSSMDISRLSVLSLLPTENSDDDEAEFGDLLMPQRTYSLRVTCFKITPLFFNSIRCTETINICKKLQVFV